MESGDYINIDRILDDLYVRFSTEFYFNQVTTQDNLFAFSGNKPYIVNLNHIECIVGEWNKERTEYGLRIFYASGNSVWIGKDPATELLLYLEKYVGDRDGHSNLKTASMQFFNK